MWGKQASSYIASININWHNLVTLSQLQLYICFDSYDSFGSVCLLLFNKFPQNLAGYNNTEGLISVMTMRRSSTDSLHSETGEHYFKTITDNFYNGPNNKQQMKYLFNKIYKYSIKKTTIYGNQKGKDWETHKYEEIDKLLNNGSKRKSKEK